MNSSRDQPHRRTTRQTTSVSAVGTSRPRRHPPRERTRPVESIGSGSFSEFRYPTPPCAVVTRRSLKTRLGGSVELLGTHDTTIGGSRSGHAPLILWYALHRYGLDGLRNRVRYAREMAAYTVEELNRIGWLAWRHPHAMTVVLNAPPADIATRWAIPISGGKAHLITMPSVTSAQIGQLLGDLRDALAPDAPASRQPAPAAGPTETEA